MKFDSAKKVEPVPVGKAIDPVEDILEEAIGKVEEVKASKEYTVIVDLLNVRKSPDGDILRTVKSGEVVKGVEEKDGWIKLDNGEGFVMSKFVAPKKG